MRVATVGTSLSLVGALALVGTGRDDRSTLTEVAERPDLPVGAPYPGAEGAEDSALDLATAFEAVDASPGTPCPAEDLVVSWADPGDTYASGAHYTPVGPPPTGVETANGVVACRGSDHDHAGFTADWDDGRWQIDFAPDFGEAHTDEGEPEVEGEGSDGGDGADDLFGLDPDERPAPSVPPPVPTTLDLPEPTGPTDLVERLDDTLIEVSDITDLRLTRTWRGLFDEHPIEDLAAYEPQTSCSPVPKAGTVGFSEMVLEAFRSTGTSGIGRDCGQGGRSEHKEGRAWDWSAHVDDDEDRAAASQVIGWLLATDEHGNEYAMARRLGLMYVIYNQSIWRSYAPEAGWVGYTGPNPHVDHVHFSFTRAGGLGDTSFWQVADLPDVDASDFGPYALLPDAGGVPVIGQPEAPQGGGNGGEGPGPVRLPRPGQGGGPAAPPSVPPPPAPPAPPLPTLPPVTLPPLPPLPPRGGGGGGGLLPRCPPGTPLLPVPTHCLLRRG